MSKAGFRYVFLGIENILEDDLKFLRASSKNTKREDECVRRCHNYRPPVFSLK